MSKTRTKQHSELDHFRAENKQLQKENRTLKKRLKRLEKKEHFFDKTPDDGQEEVIDTRLTCPNCGKGKIDYKDLVFIEVYKCNLCDYEERKRKNREKNKS